MAPGINEVFSPEGNFAYATIEGVEGEEMRLSMLPYCLSKVYEELALNLGAVIDSEDMKDYIGQFVITFQTKEDLESFCEDINWDDCPDAEGHPGYRNLVTFKDINVTEIRNEAYNLRII